MTGVLPADSDDLDAFGASAHRALQDLAVPGEMRARLRVPDELLSKTWRTVVELGWSGICIPEEHGGLGLGVDYLVALGVAIGGSLAVGPFSANLAIAPALLQLGVDGECVAELLPAIASGEIVLTSRCTVGDSGTPTVDHPSVANRALLVRFDALADIVRGEMSIVDITLPGVLRDEVQTFDPTRGARPVAIDTAAAVGASCTHGFEISAVRLDRALLPLRLFIAAQALGVAQRALQIAIEHVSARRQFDRPLGSFQAIKHQLADVHLANEKARVLTQSAAREAVAGLAGADLDCHLAWIAATRAAVAASQACLQAHGAVGFAWEHPCHLFLKRAHSLAAGFAGVVDSREHVRQYVNQTLAFEAPRPASFIGS